MFAPHHLTYLYIDPIGRYDLVECLMDYRTAVAIHGDDVLGHANWEIGEMFLRKYGYGRYLFPICGSS
jgi:hypothetical protein